MTTKNEVEQALSNYELAETTETDTTINIKFKHYSRDRELWTEVNSIIKNFGGKWLSMGKQSHWEISKVTANTKLSDEHNHIQHAIDYMKMALDEFKQAGYQ